MSKASVKGDLPRPHPFGAAANQRVPTQPSATPTPLTSASAEAISSEPTEATPKKPQAQDAATALRLFMQKALSPAGMVCFFTSFLTYSYASISLFR